MVSILLVINVIVPLIWCLKKSYIDGRIEINHHLTFAVGFLFYWIVPPVVFLSGVENQDDNYYTLIQRIWCGLDNATICKYLLCTLAIFLAVIVGDFIASLLDSNATTRKRVIAEQKNSEGLVVLALFLTALLACAIFLNRDSIGSGYADVYSRVYDGFYSGVVMALGAAAALNIVYTSPSKLSRGLLSYTGALLLIGSLLLMTTGGRLYIATVVIALVCLYSVFYCRIRAKYFILAVGAVGILFGLVGVMRGGGISSTVIGDIAFNVFAEPLFSSYTTAAYLSAYDIAWINYPVSFASSFLNLIPSVVLPDKETMIITYETLGYQITAPQGTQNLFVSLNIDFGLIGALIAMCLFSMLLHKLHNSKSKLGMVVYAMFSACLMFTLFRDAFSVSIVKNMFELSFITPLILNLFFSGRRQQLEQT